MAKKKTYNVYVNETTNEFKNTKKNEIFNVQLNDTPQTIKSGKGTDTLYLKGVSSLDELTFTKEGRNLIVADKNNKQVIIQNYFTNTNGNATKSSIKKIRLDITETTDLGEVASTKDYNILNESLINYDPVITKRSKKGLIKGTNFNDTIVGSTKADKIKGGKGDDIIYGGAGNDKLYGGAGADTFIFDTYSKVNPVTGTTEYYGSGADKIYDATSVDTLQFTTSKVSDLTFTKSKKNLIIKYYDVDDENGKTTQNSVTLVNYYKQKAANRLTKIVALNQYGKLVEYDLNEVNSDTFTDTNTEKPEDYAETITIGTTEGETEKTLSNTTNRDQLVFEKSTFKNCNFYKKGDDLLIEYKDETVENGETGTVTVTDYFKEDGKTKIDAFVDMNGLTHSLTDADIQKETLTFSESSNENIFFGREGNDLVVVCLNEDPYKRAIYENNTITTYENYFTNDSDTTLGSYIAKDGEHAIDSENLKTVVRTSDLNTDNEWSGDISNKSKVIILDDLNRDIVNLKGIERFDFYNINYSLILSKGTEFCSSLYNCHNNIVLYEEAIITDALLYPYTSEASSNNIIYSKDSDAIYWGCNNIFYGTDKANIFNCAVDNPGTNNIFYGGAGDDMYFIDFIAYSNEDKLLKNIVNDTSGDDKLMIGACEYNANLFFDVSLDESNKAKIGNDLIITAEDLSNQSVRPAYGVWVENYFTESGRIETVQKVDGQAYNYSSNIKSTLQYGCLQTIANEVASWLTSDGRSYDSTQAVFDSGNSTDIQALLKVYSDNSASAWQ